MNESEQINRRSFLSIATRSIGGVISLMLGIPAIAYTLGPALSREKSQSWMRLGSINKVALGTPTLFKVSITRETGWLVQEEKIGVYVLTDNGRDFIAMSNICTHLGCRVRWIADQQIFLSPCHYGVFDREGKVISGPPPRPLDRYEEDVLNETARLLKPGARFVFCVPNEDFTRQLSIARFLDRLGLRWLGDAYRRLFNRVSRHLHCDAPATWEARLITAGFEIEQHWDYFSPSALSALEWGHYFGLPAAICKLLFGRWILAPWRWNLWPTLALVRRYYNEPIPQDGGAYTFYSTRRAAGIALRSPGNNE